MNLVHIHDLLSDVLDSPQFINRYSPEAKATFRTVRDAIHQVYQDGVRDGAKNVVLR